MRKIVLLCSLAIVAIVVPWMCLRMLATDKSIHFSQNPHDISKYNHVVIFQQIGSRVKIDTYVNSKLNGLFITYQDGRLLELGCCVDGKCRDGYLRQKKPFDGVSASYLAYYENGTEILCIDGQFANDLSPQNILFLLSNATDVNIVSGFVRNSFSLTPQKP